MTEIKEIVLKERYDVICSECGHEFQAEPSLAMQVGINTGHGTCSKCKTFLHLEIDPDLSGDKMKSIPHSKYVDDVRNLG